MDYLKIYTDCFNNKTYSTDDHIQYHYATNAIEKLFNIRTNIKLIDIGSGRGQLLALVNNFNTPIDITSVDLKKFNDIPVNNFIPCDLSKEPDRANIIIRKYDVVTCLDVFEHLDKFYIEDVIKMCATISPISVFSIANHSDIINGIELHTIQENDIWWEQILLKYFTITDKKMCYNGRLYMYICESKICQL